LVKYLTGTFLVGSPVEIKNAVLTSKSRFLQLRVMERFCISRGNKRSDGGAS